MGDPNDASSMFARRAGGTRTWLTEEMRGGGDWVVALVPGDIWMIIAVDALYQGRITLMPIGACTRCK